MSKSRILVWDFPTRTFHWLLVVSFAGAYVTAEVERLERFHFLFGYTAAGLVVFRLLWGLIGSHHTRFSSFPFSPRATLDYARSLFGPAPQRFIGHNPLGSWSVVLLLATQGLVFATGLGALWIQNHDFVADLHEGMAAAALALVAVHVTAVLLSSLLHRENLTRAMITGYKSGTAEESASGARPFAAIILVALVVALWSGIVPVPGIADPSGALAATAAQYSRDHDHDDD